MMIEIDNIMHVGWRDMVNMRHVDWLDMGDNMHVGWKDMVNIMHIDRLDIGRFYVYRPGMDMAIGHYMLTMIVNTMYCIYIC